MKARSRPWRCRRSRSRQPCDPDFAPPQLEAEQAKAAAGARRRGRIRRLFRSPCSKASPAPARRRSISRPSRQRCGSGRQALILMPEIALTAQFLDRFAARFGARPAEWHSGIARASAPASGRGVAQGEVKVVAGARSALFLPFSDLGLIVVDEEHEAAYKQDDGVSYHARDMAVVRGRIEERRSILASATPSIEIARQCRAGPLPASAARRALRRRAAAGDHRRRSAPRIAAARQLDFAAARRGRRRGAGAPASRRCSFSTGAAMRR